MKNDEQPHSRFKHVYAIVRMDFPLNQQNPENMISVVKVFSSKMDAEKEVVRLSGVNSDKACRYILQTTRLVPPVN